MKRSVRLGTSAEEGYPIPCLALYGNAAREAASMEWSDIRASKLNRDLKPSHLAQLRRSMEAYGYLTEYPITVDEDGYVIDGNHRLYVAREFGETGSFVIADKLTPHIAADAVRCVRPWDSEDYLTFWAKQGNTRAVRILGICRQYGIPPASVLLVLHLHGQTLRQADTSKWPTDEQIDAAVPIIQDMTVLELVPGWGEGRAFKARSAVSAYMRLRDISGFDYQRFRQRLSKYGTDFVRYHTPEQLLDEMVRLYNIRTPAEYCLTVPATAKRRIRHR